MSSGESGCLVIDCDCGSDDAMALMLALGGARAGRLLAVTCCFGNAPVDVVCDNVRRVLRVCGRTEIPVYRGSNHPLERAAPDPICVQSSILVHGSDGFGDCGHLFPLTASGEDLQQAARSERTVKEDAADFLVRVARDRPGEVTLVALAPLTNVAAAHTRDPGFTGRLKGIVVLGGNYTGVGNVTETAEFNFFSDPEAANLVLTECRCPVTLVPWETCLENGMEWEDFHAMVQSPGPKAELLRAATSIVSKFCLEEGDPAFLDCDVLAVVAALWPECVANRKRVDGTMGVVLEPGRRGMCIVEGGAKKEGGATVELVTKFHKDMLKDLRKDMISERTTK